MRSPRGSCIWAGRGRLPGLGGRAGMAAAAAGAGAGAAQEKQFPPALLSFFIYNPRFGPREGEVSGAGPRAGVRKRPRRAWGGRTASGPSSRRVRRGVGPGPPGAGQHLSPCPRRAAFTGLLCARCVPGPGATAGATQRGQRLF